MARRLGSSIFHIHLEDIGGREHYHLVPGEGDMDFQAIFLALDSIGYEGFVTVELYTCPENPEQAARQAIDYLNSAYNQFWASSKRDPFVLKIFSIDSELHQMRHPAVPGADPGMKCGALMEAGVQNEIRIQLQCVP